MNFKQIKTAVYSRITKANVLWAGIAWITFDIYDMIYIYDSEVKRIGLSSLNYLGVNISSQLGFFEVLKSANFNSYSHFVKFPFLTIWLPTLAVIWSVKFCILEEKHLGWKRVLIVLLVAFTIFTLIFIGPSELWMPMALMSLLFGLVLSAVVRWVFKGFESK